MLIDGVNARIRFETGRFWLGTNIPRRSVTADRLIPTGLKASGDGHIESENPSWQAVGAMTEAYGTFIRGVLRDGRLCRYWGLKIVDFSIPALPRMLGDAAMAGSPMTSRFITSRL